MANINMSEVARLTMTAAMIWQGEACPRGHGDDYQQPQRTTPSNCFNLAASEKGLPAFGEARYRADARQRPGSEQTAGAEDDGTPGWRAVLGHGQYGQWGNCFRPQCDPTMHDSAVINGSTERRGSGIVAQVNAWQRDGRLGDWGEGKARNGYCSTGAVNRVPVVVVRNGWSEDEGDETVRRPPIGGTVAGGSAEERGAWLKSTQHAPVEIKIPVCRCRCRWHYCTATYRDGSGGSLLNFWRVAEETGGM